MILSNKYRNLAQNTAIFAIGTFSSKLLVFIMMPIYTRALSTAEYGTVDLIQQISNLLVPIVTLGVTNALIRFGLDKSFRKNDVFTTGIICFLGGFSLLLCFSPLIHMISVTSDHTVMLYFFVLMSAMREMCSQFSRAKGYVKLYAFDGFLTTFMTCLLTIIFLMGFKWGTNGYLSAIIITDALSSLFLFFSARLYKNIKFKGLDKRTFKMMLRYAIPMIPTTLLWWIVSVSDRYIITYMLGADANGLYAAAYKIPTIVVLVSTIFMDAWQVSAVSEIKDRKALAKFFSNVFRGYQSIIFLAGSLLIPFSKICTIILVAGDYYESWRYIPFLMLATIYNCMVQFMGSVYMIERKGVTTLVTSIIAAVTNIVGNFILIPICGVNGAAYSTCFSYFIVFVIRAIHTRKFIRINYSVLKFGVNAILTLAQAIIMITEVPGWIIYEVILTLLVLLLNIKVLILSFKKIVGRFGRKKAKT